MASKFSADISEKFLKCGICNEDYNQPKGLPCLHFFCEQCLTGYVISLTQDEPRRSFPCPTCKREVEIPENGISGLPKMCFIENLKEHLTKLQSLKCEEKLCDNCDYKSAHLMCDECDHALCKACKEHHDGLKVMRAHHVGTLKEIRVKRAAAKISDPVFCEKHPVDVLKFYCAKEKLPICLSCKVTDHEGHRTISIEEASTESLAKLKMMVTHTENQFERINNQKEKWLKYEKSFDYQNQEIEHAARAHADRLIQAIESLYKEVIEAKQVLYHQSKNKITQHTSKLNATLATLENIHQLAKHLIQYGRPADVVQLTHTLEESGAQHTEITDPTKRILIYEPGIPSTANVKAYLGKVENKILPNYSKVQKTRKFQSNWHNGMLILENDDIVISGVNTMKQYTSDGNVVREFIPGPDHPFGYLTGMAQLQNGNIAVADKNTANIKVFSQNGDFVKTMLDGKVKMPWGITINREGHLFVCDKQNKQVCIFDMNEELLSIIRYKFNQPIHVTISTLNNDIIVSDNYAHSIVVFDSTCALRYTYGSRGQGNNQLKNPLQTCTDYQGNIFIADNWNFRIVIISPDGKLKYIIANKNIGLHKPMLLSFNKRGELVVG